MLSKEKIIPVAEKLMILALVLCVLIPISPRYLPIPSRDSGVFMYTGWRILEGEIPYRDVWDHKPPLIFYINTLGLAVSGGSTWGVWAFEVAFLFGAGLIAFSLFKKAFGIWPAVLASFFWLKLLSGIIQGGNFTTEYTLPFQFALLLLFWKIEQNPEKPKWDYRWLIVGIISAVIFFFKQNVIAIPCAIGIYLFISRIRSRQIQSLLRQYLLIFTGGIAVIAILAGYFYLNGALAHFWSAAFEFNFAYCATSASRIKPLIRLYHIFGGTKRLVMAVTALVTISIAIHKKHSSIRHALPLLLLAAIALPLEIILVSSSGRAYRHYFMALLPVISIFAALALWSLFTLLSLIDKNKILAIALVLALSPFLFPYPKIIIPGQPNLKELVNFLNESTNPGDYVLIWGAESTVNFMTKRPSPTRFVYQYPLYEKKYATVSMIEEYVQSIIKNPPHYIIDSKNEVTSMEKFMDDFYIKSSEIDKGIDFIRNNYREVKRLQTGERPPWIIYEYQPDKAES